MLDLGKEIPITARMARAVRDGGRGMTWKIMEPQPIIDGEGMWHWRDCQWMDGGIGFPWSGIPDHAPWKPGDRSRFMDETGEEISLRVNDVRAGRLQDITDAEAVLGGVYGDAVRTPREELAELWDARMSAEGRPIGHSWSCDPWVWIIEMGGDRMDSGALKEKVESMGLTWRGDELDAMSDAELRAGYLKFNIPDPKTPEAPNGEGVWGWGGPEVRAKYDDDEYTGKLKVILCNDPDYYRGILCHGVEVVIQCNGDLRPILDPEWVREELIDSGLWSIPDEADDADRMREIGRAALETWGPEAQTLMMMEEMSELQKELCKDPRGIGSRDAIAEEIADVEIVLAQMKILHDCEELAAQIRERKLDRLAQRISTVRQGPELPELSYYDESHVRSIPWTADDDRDGLLRPYQFRFRTRSGLYECDVEARGQVEATGIFFREHPHITYDMVETSREGASS